MAKRRHENAISLFPFLAVLVCTMGALILLLLVTTRRIRQKQQEAPIPIAAPADVDEAQVADAEQLPEPEFDSEPVVKMSEWLDVQAALSAAERQRHAVREALAEQKRRHAAVLDQLEQEQRRLTRLRQELEEARQRRDRAKLTAAGGSRQLEELRTEQAALEQRLRMLQRQSDQSADELAGAEALAVAAEQLVSRRNSALLSLRELSRQEAETPRDAGTAETIIEFSNSSGTSRTPIIVELGGDGFLFPASGIKVRRKDMDGVSASDNPLLSGVLAIHRQRSADQPGTRPYVLLLVRPEGTLDFYLAQRVFKASQLHFGYELVTSDQKVAAPEPADGEVEAVRVAVLNSLMRRQQYYDATSALQQKIAALQEAQRGQRGPAAFRQQPGHRPGHQPFGAWEEAPRDSAEGRMEVGEELTQLPERTAENAEPSAEEQTFAGSPEPRRAQFDGFGSQGQRQGQRQGRGQGQGQDAGGPSDEERWQSIPSFNEARTQVERELERALAARRQAQERSQRSEAPYAPGRDESVAAQDKLSSPSNNRLADSQARALNQPPAGAAGQPAVGNPEQFVSPFESAMVPGEQSRSDVAQLSPSAQQPVRFPPLNGQTYRPHDASPRAAGTASGPSGQASGASGASGSGLVSYEQITIFLDPQHYTVSGRESVPLHGQAISRIVGSLAPQLYEISRQNRHPLAEVTLPAAKFVVSPGAHTLYLQLASALHEMNIPVSSEVTMDAFVPWPSPEFDSPAAASINEKTDQVSSERVLP